MLRYQIVPIDGITRATLEGTLDFDATAAVLHAVALENEASGKHLLIDLRGAEGQQLSYTDVHRLVQLLDERPHAFRGRIALLDHYRESFEKTQFFEASADIKGFDVRSFLDEARAIAWLEGETPPA